MAGICGWIDPEGRLVRDADKLEMIHQALRYEQTGQRNLAEFFATPRWNFTLSAQLYATLAQRHG